jgi:hypothetical protein
VAGPATHDVVKGGTNQIALIGSSFASLSVSVEDSQDDPMLVVDAVVLFTAPATDAKRRFVNGTDSTASWANTEEVGTTTAFC